MTCRSGIKLGLHRCSACAPPFPAPSQKMCKSHMSSTPQAFLEGFFPKRTYSIVSLSFNGWAISPAQEHSPFAQSIRKIWVWCYMPKRLMSLQFPDSTMDFHSLMKCGLDTAEKNEEIMFLLAFFYSDCILALSMHTSHWNKLLTLIKIYYRHLNTFSTKIANATELFCHYREKLLC